MGKKTKSRKSKKILMRKKTAARRNFPDRMAVNPNVLLQDAYSLAHRGKTPEARHLLETLLNRPGNDPTFLNQLGVLAHMLGKSDIGLNLLRKSVKLNPVAPLYNNLGLVQEQMDDLDGARHSYEQAVINDPDFPQAHYNLGNVLQKKSLFAEAVEAYRKAIHLQKDYAAAYSNMAHAQIMLGELDAGEASCLAAIRITPDSGEAITAWCNIITRKENPEKVLTICDETLDFVRQKDLIYGALGDILADRGNNEEAFRAYQKALKVSARCGKIYLRMAMLKKFQPQDTCLQEMKKKHRDLSNPEDKQYVFFALGKAYEDLQESPRAFQYIQEGNKLIRRAYTYSINEDKKFFHQLKTIFTRDRVQQAADYGVKNNTPIFIVGMPRSGTTLVEQILASHSRVYGAGELTELDRILRNIVLKEGTRQFPDGIGKLKQRHYKRIGTEYITSLKKHSAPAERIVDKMPHNFFWLGLIRIALPGATIIHCKRDPMDTCWSIYKNIFEVPHVYAQDQRELGQYYRLYLDLMDHWKKIMPQNIYEIEYEKLVQNQESETRKLLEHCTLPWENGCLDFHRAERRILTSSMAQVRNPIYSSSIKKWKHFEKELQPLSAIIHG